MGYQKERYRFFIRQNIFRKLIIFERSIYLYE